MNEQDEKELQRLEDLLNEESETSCTLKLAKVEVKSRNVIGYGYHAEDVMGRSLKEDEIPEEVHKGCQALCNKLTDKETKKKNKGVH